MRLAPSGVRVASTAVRVAAAAAAASWVTVLAETPVVVGGELYSGVIVVMLNLRGNEI